MIFLDTNVVSETIRDPGSEAVLSWIKRFEPELALSTVVIAEIAYGVAKIRPEQRAGRLAEGLGRVRRRFAGRLHAFNEEAAIVYGDVMGAAARAGRPISPTDGMIAATCVAARGRLATRNTRHFQFAGLQLINPWEF